MTLKSKAIHALLLTMTVVNAAKTVAKSVAKKESAD